MLWWITSSMRRSHQQAETWNDHTDRIIISSWLREEYTSCVLTSPRTASICPKKVGLHFLGLWWSFNYARWGSWSTKEGARGDWQLAGYLWSETWANGSVSCRTEPNSQQSLNLPLNLYGWCQKGERDDGESSWSWRGENAWVTANEKAAAELAQALADEEATETIEEKATEKHLRKKNVDAKKKKKAAYQPSPLLIPARKSTLWPFMPEPHSSY